MKRFLTIFLTLALLLGLFALPAGASSATLDTAAKKAAAFAVSSVPHPGAGDDWAHGHRRKSPERCRLQSSCAACRLRRGDSARGHVGGLRAAGARLRKL